MGFFEDLGKKLGSATDTAADKARKLAETSKLKSQIAAQEKQIDKWFYEMGKKAFELEKDNPDSPQKDLCDNILRGQESIRKIQTQISELKEAK